MPKLLNTYIDPSSLHKVYTWELYAADLSYAFSALRRFRNALSLTDCMLSMCRYPVLERRRVKTAKKDDEGHPIYKEKITEVPSDIRWVLSFEWKTRDPAEARLLEYAFYDDGWTGKVSVALDEAAKMPVIDPDANNKEQGDEAEKKPALRWQVVLETRDTKRAEEISSVLAEQLAAFESKEG